MTRTRQARARWLVVVVFAIGMAWVEAAAVYYLRAMVDRLDPYQANPLPMHGVLEPVELVQYQRAQLNELLNVPVDPSSDLEAWETGDTLVDQWPKQLPDLRPRIQEADRRYQQLLDRFRKSPSQP